MSPHARRRITGVGPWFDAAVAFAVVLSVALAFLGRSSDDRTDGAVAGQRIERPVAPARDGATGAPLPAPAQSDAGPSGRSAVDAPQAGRARTVEILGGRALIAEVGGLAAALGDDDVGVDVVPGRHLADALAIATRRAEEIDVMIIQLDGTEAPDPPLTESIAAVARAVSPARCVVWLGLPGSSGAHAQLDQLVETVVSDLADQHLVPWGRPGLDWLPAAIDDACG